MAERKGKTENVTDIKVENSLVKKTERQKDEMKDRQKLKRWKQKREINVINRKMKCKKERQTENRKYGETDRWKVREA